MRIVAELNVVVTLWPLNSYPTMVIIWWLDRSITLIYLIRFLITWLNSKSFDNSVMIMQPYIERSFDDKYHCKNKTQILSNQTHAYITVPLSATLVFVPFYESTTMHNNLAWCTHRLFALLTIVLCMSFLRCM